MISHIRILGVNVSAVHLHSAHERICEWVKEKKRTYVCVAPASTLVEARQNEGYCAILNKAGMITPDGVPVVWLAKLKGCHDISRTYGPDLMRLLCKQPHIKHYFFGGSTEVIRLLGQNLSRNYDAINIVGMTSPPFRNVAQVEDESTIKEINDARPDILWVGLGSPKQDYWMAMNRDLLDVPVIIGVGAAFDFIAGVKPQAPRWMQQNGLEWLFRFCCEPKRLWKRYLLGNILFVYYAIEDLWMKKL